MQIRIASGFCDPEIYDIDSKKGALECVHSHESCAVPGASKPVRLRKKEASSVLAMLDESADQIWLVRLGLGRVVYLRVTFVDDALVDVGEKA